MDLAHRPLDWYIHWRNLRFTGDLLEIQPTPLRNRSQSALEAIRNASAHSKTDPPRMVLVIYLHEVEMPASL